MERSELVAPQHPNGRQCSVDEHVAGGDDDDDELSLRQRNVVDVAGASETHCRVCVSQFAYRSGFLHRERPFACRHEGAIESDRYCYSDDLPRQAASGMALEPTGVGCDEEIAKAAPKD